MYWPEGKSDGSVTEKLEAPCPFASAGERLPSAVAGHPPITEWMTFHSVFFVGAVSVVRENWHDPPPWTAEPRKLTSLVSPAFHSFIVVTEYESEPVALQGKSEPLLSRGLLLGWPKGTGKLSIMCAEALAAKARIAAEYFMMDFVWKECNLR